MILGTGIFASSLLMFYYAQFGFHKRDNQTCTLAPVCILSPVNTHMLPQGLFVTVSSPATSA